MAIILCAWAKHLGNFQMRAVGPGKRILGKRFGTSPLYNNCNAAPLIITILFI